MIFNLGADGVSKAEQLEYDNTESGLVSDNVQDAVDELSESVGTLTERLADGNVKFQVTSDGKLQYSVYTE